VALTADHAFEGTVRVDRRLQDILSDPITGFLPMFDVSVVRLSDPDTTVVELAESTVVKSTLAAVIINSDGHEVPAQRHVNLTIKAGLPVFLATAGYEMRGWIHVGQAKDSQIEVLTLELKPFFPVTNAQIQVPGDPSEPMEVPVVLVNRDLLSVFSFDAPA